VKKKNKAQLLTIQLPSLTVEETATPDKFVHQTRTLQPPAMQSGQEGASTVVMKHAHRSMFLNCVPITREQLGHDILAKLRSSIRNTIFRSAKFYPKPNHADPVVGICLYDCDFCIPGVKGDFARTKYWDAVRSEIIAHTGILRQQAVTRWHVISRGT